MCSLNIQRFRKGCRLGDPWLQGKYMSVCSQIWAFQHLPYPWPALFLQEKKLQALNLGACGLQDKSKAFILLQPCGQSTGAAPFLQLLQGSRDAGYCETGAFWVGWTVWTAVCKLLKPTCQNFLLDSYGFAWMLQNNICASGPFEKLLPFSFLELVHSFLGFFLILGQVKACSLHSPAWSSEIYFLESSWTYLGESTLLAGGPIQSELSPSASQITAQLFSLLDPAVLRNAQAELGCLRRFSNPFLASVWGRSKEVLGTLCCAGSFEICSEQWCSYVGVYQTFHGLHHYSCHCI